MKLIKIILFFMFSQNAQYNELIDDNNYLFFQNVCPLMTSGEDEAHMDDVQEYPLDLSMKAKNSILNFKETESSLTSSPILSVNTFDNEPLDLSQTNSKKIKLFKGSSYLDVENDVSLDLKDKVNTKETKKIISCTNRKKISIVNEDEFFCKFSKDARDTLSKIYYNDFSKIFYSFYAISKRYTNIQLRQKDVLTKTNYFYITILSFCNFLRCDFIVLPKIYSSDFPTFMDQVIDIFDKFEKLLIMIKEKHKFYTTIHNFYKKKLPNNLSSRSKHCHNEIPHIIEDLEKDPFYDDILLTLKEARFKFKNIQLIHHVLCILQCKKAIEGNRLQVVLRNDEAVTEKNERKLVFKKFECFTFVILYHSFSFENYKNMPKGQILKYFSYFIENVILSNMNADFVYSKQFDILIQHIQMKSIEFSAQNYCIVSSESFKDGAIEFLRPVIRDFLNENNE